MGGSGSSPAAQWTPRRATATAPTALLRSRELSEEAAIELDDPDALVKFSRWITPAEVQIRFDTHFFLATLPAGQVAQIDGEECVDLGWFTPSGALEASRAKKSSWCSPRSSTSNS